MRRVLSLQALLSAAFLLFFLPSIFAGGKSLTTEPAADWAVLYSTEQVTIYYQKDDNDPCVAYRLKIENHTNERHTVQFGVMGKLNPACKSMYSSFDAFQVRTIVLEPMETKAGDDATVELLITRWENQDLPPVEVVIQNLTIQ